MGAHIFVFHLPMGTVSAVAVLMDICSEIM